MFRLVICLGKESILQVRLVNPDEVSIVYSGNVRVLVFQQNNYISGVLQTWFRSQRTTVTQLIAILLASCFSVRLLLEACK